MNGNLVIWVYTAFLLAGGVAGFVKAGSKPSLIAAVAFSLAFVLWEMGWLGPAWVADVLLVLLLGVFAGRLAKTRKFMPAGLMVVLTLAAVVLRRLG